MVGKSKNQVMAADNDSFLLRASATTLHDETSYRYYLHRCARNGDADTLERVLQRKEVRKQINQQDADRLTPLHYAARYSYFEAARVLVDNGADVQCRDREGITPLHNATRRKPIPERFQESVSVICLLAASGKLVINAQDKYGSTPLHFCAMRGNDVAAATLLRLDGIEVDTRDLQGSTALLISAIYGHVKIAKILLDAGADPTLTDQEGSSALHLAAMEGSAEMIELLLDQVIKLDLGSNMVDKPDKDGETPLHLSVENGNYEIAELLVKKHGADVNKLFRPETTKAAALHLACTSGKVNIVELLLQNGANPDARDAEMNTPLHRAAIADNYSAAEALLKSRGVKIEFRNRDSNTPLLSAARNGSTETVKLLLQYGADISSEDYRDKNAIYLTAEANNTNTLEVLLNHAKSKGKSSILVNADDCHGNCPLHIAAKNGFTGVVKLLLDNEADLKRKNDDEITPFLLAAQNGHTEIVRLILEKEPDSVYDEDEASSNGLHLAAMKGHPDVIKLLLQNRADAGARNAELWTPLDCASFAGHIEVVKTLLKRGVPIDPIGRDKKTPLHWAAERGHTEVVKVLLKAGADLSFTDHFQQNCLDITIEKGHEETALAIVNSDQWEAAFRNATPSSRKKKRLTTPMRKLITCMPEVAKAVFDRSLVPSKHDPEDEDFFVSLNYEFVDDTYLLHHWKDKDATEAAMVKEHIYDDNGYLLPTAKMYSSSSTIVKQNHPLSLMVSCEHEDLLAHPLILAMLANKWRTARILYFIYVVIFAFFLAMLTSYLMVAKAPYQVANATGYCNAQTDRHAAQTPFEKVSKIIIWCFAGFGILLELFQLFQVRKHYFQPTNIIDWFTYVSAILVTIDITNCGLRTDWQWQLAAVSLFIAWMNLLLFLRRVPFFGLYIVMIIDIFKTFAKFFVVFFLFIIAFALGFYILLQNQVGFRAPHYSIVKTTVMMIGEFEYDALFNGGVEEPKDKAKAVHYEALTYSFFYFFVLLMAIIVMNLLTGLAVDDVSALQEKAKLRKLAMQVDLALDVEIALPGPVRRFRGCVLEFERMFPNRSPDSLWKSMQESLSDLVAGPDNQEASVTKAILGQQQQDEDKKSPELQELEANMNNQLRKSNKKLNKLADKMDKLEKLLTGVLTQIESRQRP